MLNNIAQLAILLSGRGTTAMAIHTATLHGGSLYGKAQVACIISSNKNARGLVYAKEQGIPHYAFPKSTYGNNVLLRDDAISRVMNALNIDLICLAGYKGILTAPLLKGRKNQIINSHPSILPAHEGKFGLDVHQSVLDSDDTTTGCTIHYVTNVKDGGPHILQTKGIPVIREGANKDTAETLAARVLPEEYLIYLQAIDIALQKLKFPIAVGV